MLVLIFTGTSYAEDNPFQGLTQEQVIQYSSKSTTKIEGISKTEYSSCFRIGTWHGGLKLISVTTLMRNIGGYYGTPLYRFYTHIYPSEVK